MSDIDDSRKYIDGNIVRGKIWYINVIATYERMLMIMILIVLLRSITDIITGAYDLNVENNNHNYKIRGTEKRIIIGSIVLSAISLILVIAIVIGYIRIYSTNESNIDNKSAASIIISIVIIILISVALVGMDIYIYDYCNKRNKCTKFEILEFILSVTCLVVNIIGVIFISLTFCK